MVTACIATWYQFENAGNTSIRKRKDSLDFNLINQGKNLKTLGHGSTEIKYYASQLVGTKIRVSEKAWGNLNKFKEVMMW